MAFFCINNVKVIGISACVPSKIENIEDYPLFNEVEKQRMLPFFGLSKHRVVDEKTTPSDLCYAAAEKLLEECKWSKESIDILVYVSSTPDYIFPSTCCVLHDRLGLKQDCAAFDIPFGCSGWIYGLTVICNLLSSGTIKRGLLLVGDTPSRAASKEDKSVYPFFGDAGSATAIEYEPGAFGLRAELGTIGSGYDKIIMPDGGMRNPVTEDSSVVKEFESGVKRCNLNTHIDGVDVFALSTKLDPVSIRTVLEKANISIDDVDCFAFHQTNKFLSERVRKILKLAPEKVPYSLENFSNTSAASIPLTLVTERRDLLVSTRMRIVGCALGVGLSLGACYLETDKIIVPSLVEYNNTK